MLQPRYQQTALFGPFYRLANDRTQTKDDMLRIARSGELWGRPRRNSNIPTVKAYFGKLPVDAEGFEFWTFVEPHNRFGPDAYWLQREDQQVWGDSDWAKVRIAITRLNQE